MILSITTQGLCKPLSPGLRLWLWCTSWWWEKFFGIVLFMTPIRSHWGNSYKLYNIIIALFVVHCLRIVNFVLSRSCLMILRL